MTTGIIVTKAIIDDTDLYIKPILNERRYQRHESHSNESSDEIQLSIDDNCLAEREVMISLGLPVDFGSMQQKNRKTKRKQNKIKKRYKQQDLYFETNDLLDEIIDCKDRIQQCLPQLLSNCVINTQTTDGNDTNDCPQSSTNPKDDDKQKDSKTSQVLMATTSTPTINSFSSCLVNDDSSDNEPPEENPVVIKREHESDSLILNEDILNKSKTKMIRNIGKTNFNKSKKPKDKYWGQRYRLFSLFDEGIRMDAESWYSVTPERIAQHIANRFARNSKNQIIVDAFCGSGGNTIQFALISEAIRVIAVDIDIEKIMCAKHNAKIYGVDNRIEFILADYMVLAKTGALKADSVFLSPPWGGPRYNKRSVYKLDMMTPTGNDCYEVTKDYITSNIGLLLPRNIDIEGVKALAGIGNSVEIEHNLLNNKIKTMTAYFGNLIKTP